MKIARFLRYASLSSVLFSLCFALAWAAPAADQILPPDSFLGFKVGEDRKVADWQQVVGYFQKVASAAPERVKFGNWEIHSGQAVRGAHHLVNGELAIRPSQFLGATKGGTFTDAGQSYRGDVCPHIDYRPSSNRQPRGLYHRLTRFYAASPLNPIFMLGGAPEAHAVLSKMPRSDCPEFTERFLPEAFPIKASDYSPSNRSDGKNQPVDGSNLAAPGAPAESVPRRLWQRPMPVSDRHLDSILWGCAVTKSFSAR
jgi:hypothetical protein